MKKMRGIITLHKFSLKELLSLGDYAIELEWKEEEE